MRVLLIVVASQLLSIAASGQVCPKGYRLQHNGLNCAGAPAKGSGAPCLPGYKLSSTGSMCVGPRFDCPDGSMRVFRWTGDTESTTCLGPSWKAAEFNDNGDCPAGYSHTAVAQPPYNDICVGQSPQSGRANGKEASIPGFNPGTTRTGGKALELIALILDSVPIQVSDNPGHVLTRDLITLRLDFPRSDYKEWFEIICTETKLGEPNSPWGGPSKNACHSLVRGKKYRFITSEDANAVEFHAAESMYPVSVYQVWRRCFGSTTECLPYTRGPIIAIRRPNGKVE